jgi:hypothetical protein
MIFRRIFCAFGQETAPAAPAGQGDGPLFASAGGINFHDICAALLYRAASQWIGEAIMQKALIAKLAILASGLMAIILPALTIICVATNSHAQSSSTPVEPGAQISKNITRAQTNAMADFIRLNGYRCDSISGAVNFLTSAGFRFVCNQNRYVYELEDRGGNWVITLK